MCAWHWSGRVMGPPPPLLLRQGANSYRSPWPTAVSARPLLTQQLGPKKESNYPCINPLRSWLFFVLFCKGQTWLEIDNIYLTKASDIYETTFGACFRVGVITLFPTRGACDMECVSEVTWVCGHVSTLDNGRRAWKTLAAESNCVTCSCVRKQRRESVQPHEVSSDTYGVKAASGSYPQMVFFFLLLCIKIILGAMWSLWAVNHFDES